MRPTCTLLALTVASAQAHAATLRVPEDHPTVADAVAAAATGDTIAIGAGVFPGVAVVTNVDLTFEGAGAGATVLDGGRGTAIVAGGGSITVRDLTVSSTLDDAAAVDLEAGFAAFERVTFEGNERYTGFAGVQAVLADVSFDTCTFEPTAAAVTVALGALDSVDTAFTLTGNGTGVGGGTVTMTGGSITSASNTGYPAVIYVYGGDATLSGLTIDGAYLSLDGGTLTLTDSVVTGAGGGMYGYPHFVVQRTTFDHVSTDYEVIGSWGTLVLEDSVFVDCDADALVQGWNGWTDHIEARRNLFTGSSARAAFAVYSGTALLEDNAFLDNVGAQVEMFYVDDGTLSGNTFTANAADDALVDLDASFGAVSHVSDNVFRDNRSTVGVRWSSDVEIVHNLFLGHVIEDAPDAFTTPGLLMASAANSHAQVTQNTIASLEGPGPAVGTVGGQVDMRNNLVIGHRGPNAAVAGPVTPAYNLFWDNAGGDLASGALPATNVSADPLLDTWREGPSAALDLVLLPGSPAIDAGHPEILDADGGPSDIGYTGGPTADPLLAVDADGDGSSALFDCDDNDSAVFPGQQELCGDGVDSDCDGVADEGLAYTDTDGDGFGDPTGRDVVDVCTAEGVAPVGTDCDDADPAVSPDGIETCDGRDEDCDGDVDEGACSTQPTEPDPTEPDPTDPGTPGADDPSDAPDAESGGCGCVTTPGAAGSFAGLAAVVGLIALRRRRS